MKTLNTMTFGEWMQVEEILYDGEILDGEEFIEFVLDNRDELNAYQYALTEHSLEVW